MSATLTPPLKWHGGKTYLASRIVALMPPHMHYVEPFGGGAAVLLGRDPNDRRLWAAETGGRSGVSEILNDLNGELMNFWRVLQGPDTFKEFRRLVEVTPMGRLQWEAVEEMAEVPPADPALRAWSFFVRARQSRAGTFKGFTSLTRSRTRRGINGNVSEWLGAVEGLPAIHARLQPVVLENVDALKLIRREDTPDTLFYLDPPYLHETRVSTNVYTHEMSNVSHEDLLRQLAGVKGRFMLSGYPSDLYDTWHRTRGWKRHDFDLPNNAAGGKEKRRMVECVWCNF